MSVATDLGHARRARSASSPGSATTPTPCSTLTRGLGLAASAVVRRDAAAARRAARAARRRHRDGRRARRGGAARPGRAPLVPAVGRDPAGRHPRPAPATGASRWPPRRCSRSCVPPTGADFNFRAFQLPMAIVAGLGLMLVVLLWCSAASSPARAVVDVDVLPGRAPVPAAGTRPSSSTIVSTAPPDRAPAVAPAVTVRGLVKRYGRTTAVDGLDLELRAGIRARAARPQRRRQDHHRRDLRGLPARRRGRGAGARRRPGRCPGRAARPDRRDAAGRRRLPRRARRRDAAPGRRLLGAPARRRLARSTCSASTAAPAPRTSGSPAASSSGSRWPAPSSGARSWCSSTSRPPGWTRRAAGSSGS